MQILRSVLEAAVAALPEVIELPEEWPTPSNTPGAYARVMSFDILNPKNANPRIQINMEKCDTDGVTHMPQWQCATSRDEALASPSQAPFAALAMAGLTGLAAVKWGVL